MRYRIDCRVSDYFTSTITYKTVGVIKENPVMKGWLIYRHYWEAVKALIGEKRKYSLLAFRITILFR